MTRHAHLTTAREIIRPVANATADRIRAEYRELPGLCLTTEQAMRLWTLDRPTCQAALERLIRDGILERDAFGRYARNRCAPSCGTRGRKTRSARTATPAGSRVH
jgi:hypothetical protein